MLSHSRFVRGFVFGLATGMILIVAVVALLIWLGTVPSSVTLPPNVIPY